MQCRCTLPSRQTLRWLLIGLGTAVGLWLAHAPLLRTLGGMLVADQTADEFQYVGIMGGGVGPDGDSAFDAAADICRQHPACGVLLIESRRNRLVEMGILPTFAKLSSRELAARGLTFKNVSILHSDGHDDWATARSLRIWLADRPDTHIILLCERFHSAHLRYALDYVLTPNQAAQVRLRALRDRRFDETDWWTSRRGFRAFGTAWLRQLHGWCAGGDHLPPPYHNVDEYENRVRQTLAIPAP